MGRTTRRFFLVALLIAVLAGFGASLIRTPPSHTEAFLTDDEGRSLVQHGFSASSNAKSTPDGLPLLTEADVEQEHGDMGTNFVRFLISWRAVEPEPGVIDTDYLDAVSERVRWYEARGYHVMLDMHQDLWGWGITPDQQQGNGAPVWATYMDGLPVETHDMWELIYLEPGVIRAFDHFWNTSGEHPDLMKHYAGAWRAVAEHFAADDTVVMYDLMNEPYGGTMQGAAFESGPLTQLYQRVTDEIRAVDPDTWVCVEPQAFGFNWGLPSGLGHIFDPREGDPRVAFCPHLYPLPMDLGEGFTGSSKPIVERTVSLWSDNVMRTATRLSTTNEPVPVILGEFGLDTTGVGAEEYIELVYDTADRHGFGVAYWSRDDGAWGPYEEDGTARNLVGLLNRPYPRAVTELQTWALDGDALTLTVGGPGPGQVYVPPHTVNSRPQIEGAVTTSWDPESGLLEFVVETAGEVHVTP